MLPPPLGAAFDAFVLVGGGATFEHAETSLKRHVAWLVQLPAPAFPQPLDEQPQWPDAHCEPDTSWQTYA